MRKYISTNGSLSKVKLSCMRAYCTTMLTDQSNGHHLSPKNDNDAIYQKLHDLSRNLCTIIRKNPGQHGRGKEIGQTGLFGQYELTRDSGLAHSALSICEKDNSEAFSTRVASSLIHDAHNLYHQYNSQYKELSTILSSPTVLQGLVNSVKWFNERRMFNGLPIHRMRRHMHVCFALKNKPGRLHLVNSHRNRSIVEAKNIDSRLGSASFHHLFTRSLRDKETVRNLLRIVDSEWPRNDASTVPIHERLRTIV